MPPLSRLVRLCLASFPFVGPATAGAATITLDRTPAIPTCAAPGTDAVTANWSITHDTTPNEVVFTIENRARTTILHTETFPGTAGIDAQAAWSPPEGTAGDFWVRVVYASLEQGVESSAELPVYVCTETASICIEKRDDADCDGEQSGTDPIVPEYGFLCISTPVGDTLCRVSDANGEACWSGVPTGSFVASEVLATGWIAAGPTEEAIVLEAGTEPRVTFLNQRESVCASPVELGSWGRVKSTFR
jgi:hypothetical protein